MSESNVGTTRKYRIEVSPNKGNASTFTGSASPVKVVTSRTGIVTVFDKLKAYYHTLIVVFSAVLVGINELSPLTDHLPASDKHYVTLAILLVTAVVNALKSNEVWVNQLP